VKNGGVSFGCDPKIAAKVTRVVKDETSLPVIVKLTPNVTDITVIARAVAKAGADAISLINTLTGMSVDLKTRRPHLKNITGGLSGPAIKPVALRMIWQVVQNVSVPVIGIGGIMTAQDALEFLILGAKAVQIGTANFINPRVTIEVIEGIEKYLADNKLKDVNDIIGTFQP
jgi:dihydroorotate dehydrogenase (NAD+) catalytic subunit